MSELSNKISHKYHKIIAVNNEYSYKVECIGMIKGCSKWVEVEGFE